MRSLLALALAAALLAGCASEDPEPAAADNTDETEQELQAEEPPPEGDDADGDAAPETDDARSDAPEGVAPDDDGGAGDVDADDASADAVAVEIGDYFFDDDQLVIEVGETVTWTHQGDVTHNVTSQDGSFASESLNPGGTFTHTFGTAGAFEYRCTLHGQMTAEVEVA